MRLIDADKLIKELTRKVFHNYSDELWGTLQVIDEMPTETAELPWISVKDKMPEIDKDVLVYWERRKCITNEVLCFYDIMCRTSEGDWYCDGQGVPVGEVIAWMPLTPPKKEQRK